jgi:hypothetical protein
MGGRFARVRAGKRQRWGRAANTDRRAGADPALGAEGDFCHFPVSD